MPETPALPEAILEVAEPDGRPRTLRVTESPFLIGRGAESGNQLQLADTRISRRSAALVYADGVFRVEDRGQRHGLFVNGEKVESRELKDGDRITLGLADTVQIVFRTSQTTAQESLPQLLSRLDQASALEAGTRDIRQLSLLLEATALLQSHLPVQEVLSAMVDRAIAITEADRGLLFEATAQGGLRPLVARQRGGQSVPPETLTPSQTAIAQAIERHRSVVEEDLAQNVGALRQARSVVAQQLRSMVAIPLLSLSKLMTTDSTYLTPPGELLGLLYLDSRRPATFSRLERQILDALAREAGSVLDNARLVQKERERQRMEQELVIARDIQQALLPKGSQRFPSFHVTGINRPCLAVGGDYFDLMELGPERTAFVIADVSGKGLGAALVMAMLQGNFSAMAFGQEPAAVCAHVNRFICGHSEVHRYATIFYGLLDTAGRLEYVNAGHLPPLLIRGANVQSICPAGCLPLGLLPEAEFKTTSIMLEPGDTLVFYTDGITEALNPQEEQFGVDRLQEVVARYARASVEELQVAILAAVEDFARGAYQADDQTLLVVGYQQPGVKPRDSSIVD